MRKIIVKTLEEIFLYDDYRKFLHDYFDELKAKKSIFSHRFFAKKSGFTSPTYVYQVIKGDRNLTDRTLEKIIKGLDISGKEKEYFANLVKFNQAKSVEEQELYRTRLHTYRNASKFHKLNRAHIAFFSDLKLQVIRELTVFSNWDGDYKKLGAMLNPKLPAGKVKEAVETLIKIKLLKKKGNKFELSDDNITSEGLAPVFQKELRRDILLKGVASVDDFTPDTRHASFGTITMSQNCYDDVTGMFDEFRRAVFNRVSQDDNVKDKVYNMSLLLFPLTNKINEEI